MVLADTGILAATWIKTWSIRQLLKSTSIDETRSSMSLSGLILRDGESPHPFLCRTEIDLKLLGTVYFVFVDLSFR